MVVQEAIKTNQEAVLPFNQDPKEDERIEKLLKSMHDKEKAHQQKFARYEAALKGIAKAGCMGFIDHPTMNLYEYRLEEMVSIAEGALEGYDV